MGNQKPQQTLTTMSVRDKVKRLSTYQSELDTIDLDIAEHAEYIKGLKENRGTIRIKLAEAIHSFNQEKFTQ